MRSATRWPVALEASVPDRWRSVLLSSSTQDLLGELSSSPELVTPSSVRELLSLRPAEHPATGRFLLCTGRTALLILVSPGARQLVATEFFDLLAEALIGTAKGFRLTAKLELARQALRAALRASRLGTRNRGTRLLALRLLARVHSGAGTYARAHRLLSRLARVHSRAGEEEPLAVALRAMANNFSIWGYPRQALTCLAKALPLLGEQDRSLEFFSTATSFAWLALDLDFLEDAQETYGHLQRLRTPDLPRQALLRLDWLGARILRRRGHLQTAETRYRSVCDGYAEAGMHSAFLRASLELLYVLAERRRFSEVSAICCRLIEVVGPERMPAEIQILARQGGAGDLTPALLHELLRALRRSRLTSG